MANTTNNPHENGGQNPQVSWERKDVDVKQIGSFGVGLLIATGIAALAMLGLFKWFTHREEQKNAPVPQAMMNQRMKQPPAGQPQLQAEPIGELKEMRDAEEMVLTSYGWADQARGVARIPVAEAINIIAAKGLPSKPSSAGLENDGYRAIPSDASSGRTLEKIAQ